MDIDIGTLVFWIMVIVISLISWARRSQNPEDESAETPPVLRKEDLPEATRRLYERRREIPVAPPKTGQSPVAPSRPATSAGEPRRSERPAASPAPSSPRPETPLPVRRRRMDEDEFENMTEGEEPPRRVQRPVPKPSPRTAVPAARPKPAVQPVRPPQTTSVPSPRKAAPSPSVPIKPSTAPALARGTTGTATGSTGTASSGPSRGIRATLKQPASRRQAVLYREILGPPPGLRPPDLPVFDYPLL